MPVRTEYKIAHQWSLGAATIKALSPNVFDRTAGIESKIPSEDTLKKKTFT